MMAASDSLNTSIPERATSQGADATVLRQLLNQETLIRMSVEKNVHVLMKDMVSLKDSLLSLQSEMAGIRQIAKDGIADSKEKIEGLKSELQSLKETGENLEERLVEQNKTEKTNESLHSLKSEIAETKYDQLKLSAAILSLEWFRNNISSGLIDSKAPMVVAFTAGVTESKRFWSSGNLIFSTIIYNEGGAYDASTGVFTSPTDGIFVFYVTITAYSSNTIYVDIVKNRSSSVRALAYGGSSYQTGTNMAVFSLGRGDKVWVKQHSGQGFYTASTPITSFTGFMIS
uniref:Caprin-2 n=1 Tax=Magallana gigas TaxID=29159 RepID=K1Q0X8_MAGGI